MGVKKLKSTPLVSSSLRKKVSSSYYFRSNFLSAWLIRFLLLAFIFAVLYVTVKLYKNSQPKLIPQFLNDKTHFEIYFKNIRQPYTFHVSPHSTTTQCSTSTKLLILVMTRRDSFIKRDSIRKTWAARNVLGEQTVIRFLIGDPAKADNTKEMMLKQMKDQQQLENELTKFGDLILLDGIVDSYQNLHIKWYAGLEWKQNFCGSAEFVLKTDDDTIVHLPRLDHWIEHKFRPALKQNAATYFGWIIAGQKPIREKGHRWYVPKSAYPEDSYPDYLQGATYLASAQAIATVMRHAHEVNGFNMDDVLFTGILAKLANVTLFDAGAHFRVGNSLGSTEKCVRGVPEAVALYGAGNLEQFKKIYEQLNAIECAITEA